MYIKYTFSFDHRFAMSAALSATFVLRSWNFAITFKI